MTVRLKAVQESVIARMVDRNGRKIFSDEITMDKFMEDMESVVTESVQRRDDETWSLRFLNKSFHTPLVHLETKTITAKPEEIKRKDASFHLFTSTVLQYNRSSSDSSRHQLSKKVHNDSVIKGVLVAMDYDTDKLKVIYGH